MGYPRPTNTVEHYLGIGKQSSKGTGVTPTVFVPYQGEASLDGGQDGDEIREAGTGPYINRIMKTKHDPSGAFGMAARPKTAAQLLAWFLGGSAAATQSPGHDQTATPAISRTWLTIEMMTGPDGDIGERFVDCLLKKVNISCEGNKDLMLKFEWFGLTPGWQATAATPTYETGVSGSSAGGPYRGHEGSYTVDGSAATNVASWELDLEWKYDEDIRLSKVTRGDALKLELVGTLKLKQLLDGDTARDDYRKMQYLTPSGTAANKNMFADGAFVAAFDNGLSSTASRTLDITVPAITYGTPKYTPHNPDGSTMYLEREGKLTKLSASQLVSIVSNTQDAAAY